MAESGRRIPVIVYERPPFEPGRLVTFTLVGGVAGFVGGLALKWVSSFGANDAVLGVGAHGTVWGYTPALVACGLLAGAGLGWAWQRGVIARIEQIPAPSSMRSARRSSSTALASPPTD